ncbi:MAG: hypothetical protein GXO10_02265 [Crenarchaeota archaeon]|nr:hypothetical protein [Thermoproteota archaeon]
MSRRVDIRWLEKAIKCMEKLLKDLEKGKYKKYGFKNPEEAKAFAEYIRSKIEEYRKILERAAARAR